MRRKDPEKTTRTPAPAWCTNFVAGARYAVELTGSRDMKVWMPALRVARWEWCQANGCHRGGSKTCVEVFKAPCRPPARMDVR